MDKQQVLTILSHCGGFKILMVLALILLLSGCRRDTEATHHLYLHNATNKNLKFQTIRDTSIIVETQLSPLSKDLLSYGGLHHEGDDIIFKIIREGYGWQGDTVEFYHNDTLVIRWGAPLRVLPDSINHFYNENSWEITQGGRKCKWERGTFTIYESDLGKIEGN